MLRNLLFILLTAFAACQKSEPGISRKEHAPPPPPEQNVAPERASAARADEEVLPASGLSGEQSDAALFSSGAARISAVDSVKKFIRTASMQFRVKNVPEATLTIESIASRHGGYTSQSRLSSEITDRRLDPVSPDSAVETTRFRVKSALTLHIPYRELDTVLRTIGRLADFLDSRQVSAEDITLKLLAEKLEQARQRAYIQGSERENKAGERADRILAGQTAEDESRLESYRMEDAVRYSAVILDIYQLEQIKSIRVANVKIPKVNPPFAQSLQEALQTGGELLKGILLALVRLWGLFLLIGAGYLIYRRYKSTAGSLSTGANS